MNLRGVLSCCLAMMIGAVVPAPSAQALELFGFTIFGGGDDEDDAQVEVLDPQRYRVRYEIATRDEDLEKRLRRSTDLWAGRKEPAAGVAGLVATARGDYRTLLAGLYSEGYYSGSISIRIDGEEAAGRSLTAPLPEVARVVVAVDPGPRFVFGQTDFINTPPRSDDRVPRTAREQFRRGERALAGVVNEAGREAADEWRHLGFPKAVVADRTAVADHANRRLDVEIVLDPGRQARFGKTAVTGSRRVNEQFIRYMADIPEGSPFDPEVVAKGEERLNRLGVFRAVRIVEDPEIAPDGTLGVTVETVRRNERRIGFGATFSSIDGLGLEAFWLHRNLFHRAERLRFDAAISGIEDESSADDYDYLLSVTFTKPGVLTPDTSLEFSAKVEQNVFDTYRERVAGVSGGLAHIFSDRLDGSVFLDFEVSEIEDSAGTRQFQTLSLPVSLTYDTRDDELDPTEGLFLSGELRPFYEFEFGSTAVQSVTEARTYFDFNEDKTILALRGRASTIVGGEREDLPTSLLFFTGGGGSVRGFPFRSNGIEVDGETVGGRSALELSLEVRHKFTDSLGVVGFADGGVVSADTFPTDFDDLRIGVGVGLRYYSGLGPLRFDIGMPLDRKPGDPSVALYIGIGQAF